MVISVNKTDNEMLSEMYFMLKNINRSMKNFLNPIQEVESYSYGISNIDLVSDFNTPLVESAISNTVLEVSSHSNCDVEELVSNCDNEESVNDGETNVEISNDDYISIDFFCDELDKDNHDYILIESNSVMEHITHGDINIFGIDDNGNRQSTPKHMFTKRPSRYK
jgi:hypothetical protein